MSTIHTRTSLKNVSKLAGSHSAAEEGGSRPCLLYVLENLKMTTSGQGRGSSTQERPGRQHELWEGTLPVSWRELKVVVNP